MLSWFCFLCLFFVCVREWRYIYIIYLYVSADLPVKRYKKRGFRGLLLSCHRLTPLFRSVAFACSFLLEVSVVIVSSLVQSLVYTHILLSHNFRL